MLVMLTLTGEKEGAAADAVIMRSINGLSYAAPTQPLCVPIFFILRHYSDRCFRLYSKVFVSDVSFISSQNAQYNQQQEQYLLDNEFD